MPRRPTDWESAYLRALGAPNTPANRKFLASWQRWEGGHTHNDARWNYMNTTQKMPGSRPIANNQFGVQRYTSLNQGARAFAKTLRNGKYGDLVAALKSGDPYKANVTAGLSTWLSGSPDSPAGAKYTQKILGLDVAPPPVTDGGGGPPRMELMGDAPSAPPDLTAPRMSMLSQIAQGHFDPFASLQALTDSLVSQGHTRHANVVRSAKGLQVQVQGKVDSRVNRVIDLADNFLGTPYHWGGSSPQTGFDCSGLLQYAWAQNGVHIPRVTYDQWHAGVAVKKNQLRPGDAVFFEMTSRGPGHVGMYIGGGRFIEAPHTGANVRISKLAGRKDYVGARRFGTPTTQRKKR